MCAALILSAFFVVGILEAAKYGPFVNTLDKGSLGVKGSDR